MRRRPPAQKGWRGIDEEARRALGIADDEFGSYAESQVHPAIEVFKFTAIPGSSESLFRISGAQRSEVDLVGSVLLGRSSRFWREPNISMAFHSLVTGMLYHQVVYHAVQFSNASPVILERLDWLAPETLKERRRHGQVIVEQFVRRQARPDYGEYWCEFTSDEIFKLEWPLPPRSKRSPRQAALAIGGPEDRLSERSLLNFGAFNEPDEKFITYARARLRRYSGAFRESRLVAARVNDTLFSPPREPMTQFFEIDRIVRGRVAAAQVREYVVGEFNRQVLARWAARNSWGELTLQLVPRMLTADEWRQVGEMYGANELSYEDVVDFLREDTRASSEVRGS